MQNYVQDSEVLTLTAPRTLSGGEGVLVGGIFGVAVSDATSGDTDMVVSREGVFDLAKTSAQAWTAGQRIYWDNTNHVCDSDSTVGVFVGFALEAAANPSSTGRVVLAPAGSFLEGTQAAVADEATADATDLASAEALANALKAKLNTLLARLRIIGIIAS